MVKILIRRWRSYLLPAPSALTFVGVAGAFIGLGLACAILYGVSSAKTFADGFGRFAFLFGVIALPLVTVFLLIAAVREKRFLPRGLVIFGAALTVLAGGLATSFGIGLEAEDSLLTGAATFLFLCTPIVIALLGFAFYFAARGWNETRLALAADWENRAIQMIEARGEVTLNELAAELEIDVEQCDDVVEAALRAGHLQGWHDAPRGRVYSAASLRERQTRLAAIVLARGQIQFDELVRELRAPRDLVKTWVYELVKRGEFTGYINWDEGLLYSREAQRLTEAGKCPYCNGELSLAGKGVIRCKYCSSEIFL